MGYKETYKQENSWFCYRFSAERKTLKNIKFFFSKRFVDIVILIKQKGSTALKYLYYEKTQDYFYYI